ncbi:3'-5' exonuclease [Chitinibacter bivalviorum]|uniref:3'-5' exonuclease n=1 Tax=Chitinibacter bivalviorum TaxID=2739434 RepID=A0A7H9BDJ0_9NEIS|nr:3'-5' exonuclease [Chitinibacter bivalviorum]QLG86770.1 3'-5' exonuclease [Chitinibacter bivalviorum]
MSLFNGLQLSYWLRRYAQSQLRHPQFAFLFAAEPEQEWVSIDCETTSLDPKVAEIISIAAVRIRGSRIELSDQLSLLIKPSGQLDPKSIPIHGLRTQDVATGLSIEDALSQLLNFIGARPLIGYYLEFDLAVINRQLKPWLGIQLPNRAIDVSGMYYDRTVSAYNPEVDLRLESILRNLDLPHLSRHDPLNDALMAAMIFQKLRKNPNKS